MREARAEMTWERYGGEDIEPFSRLVVSNQADGEPAMGNGGGLLTLRCSPKLVNPLAEPSSPSRGLFLARSETTSI